MQLIKPCTCIQRFFQILRKFSVLLKKVRAQVTPGATLPWSNCSIMKNNSRKVRASDFQVWDGLNVFFLHHRLLNGEHFSSISNFVPNFELFQFLTITLGPHVREPLHGTKCFVYSMFPVPVPSSPMDSQRWCAEQTGERTTTKKGANVYDPTTIWFSTFVVVYPQKSP